MKIHTTNLTAFTFFIVSLIFVNQVLAGKVATPETLPGVQTVDVDWVKANMDSATIVDTRKKAVYVLGHIPGSLNIFYKVKSDKTPDADLSKDRFDLSKLSQEKNSKIIVYCHAEFCWNSYKAAQQMLAAGYTNLYWFRGGFPAWESAGNPVE